MTLFIQSIRTQDIYLVALNRCVTRTMCQWGEHDIFPGADHQKKLVTLGDTSTLKPMQVSNDPVYTQYPYSGYLYDSAKPLCH